MLDGTYRLPSLDKNKSSTALGKRSQADEEEENNTPMKMARQEEDSDDE